MKIAILLHNYDHVSLDDNYLQAVIVDFDESKGFGIEHDYVNLENMNQFALWLISKEIEMVFIPEDNEEIENTIARMGIVVKKHSDLDKPDIVKLFLKK